MSTSTMDATASRRTASPRRPAGRDSGAVSPFDTIMASSSPAFARPAGRGAATDSGRPRIDIDPDNVRRGLGQLVLTLVQLIRELMERQALRRVEGGSLTDEEIERLGITFQKLGEEMERLKGVFGLEDDDLNIDLGPLGKLL